MSLRKLSTRTRVAISKAQKSSGQVVPDLANRVTALEQEDQAINTDLNALFINDAAQDTDITALQASDTAQNSAITALQNLNINGYSGTIVFIDTINFTTQATTTKSLTYLNGKLIEVV